MMIEKAPVAIKVNQRMYSNFFAPLILNIY